MVGVLRLLGAHGAPHQRMAGVGLAFYLRLLCDLSATPLRGFLVRMAWAGCGCGVISAASLRGFLVRMAWAWRYLCGFSASALRLLGGLSSYAWRPLCVSSATPLRPLSGAFSYAWRGRGGAWALSLRLSIGSRPTRYRLIIGSRLTRYRLIIGSRLTHERRHKQTKARPSGEGARVSARLILVTSRFAHRGMWCGGVCSPYFSYKPFCA